MLLEEDIPGEPEKAYMFNEPKKSYHCIDLKILI